MQVEISTVSETETEAVTKIERKETFIDVKIRIVGIPFVDIPVNLLTAAAGILLMSFMTIHQIQSGIHIVEGVNILIL